MKVVKEGTKTVPWYVGLQSTCSRCGTVVEFGRDDKFKVQNDMSRFGDGGQFISFYCPGCKGARRVAAAANALFWIGKEAAEKVEKNRYDLH